MKTKFRKFIAVLLMLSIITTLTACNDAVNSKKWVLTYEKRQYSDEYDNPSIIHEVYYEYDYSRKMTSEKIVLGSTEFISSNFIYDDEGNLINKSGTKKDYFNGESSYSYSYTYDENGNCVSEFVDWGTDTDTTTNVYNEFGDIIESHSIYKSDTYKVETNLYFTHSYENDICAQSELKSEMIDENGTTTSFAIKKYTYDTNGNKISELYYTEIESEEEAKNPIFINGRYYMLDWTTEYTYQLLDDVAISAQTNNNESDISSNTQDSNEPEEVKLSDGCDMILCTSYDGDDCYELVANQIDGYPDSTFEFGVLKNNEWLVQMSSVCPFIDERGWWKGAKYSNIPGEFKYMSEGCFYYRRDDESSKGGIIYKPETGVCFEVVWFGKFSPYSGDNEEDYSKLINKNSEYLGLLSDFTFSYMNLNTGESRAISLELKGMGNNQDIGLLSDGVFYAKASSNFSGTYYSGFFDLNGNQIIDFTKYHCTDLGDYMFHNGQYTLTCKNNSGVEFDITFDTSGKIVSQEKCTVQ